jgi:hypothetical protein
MPTPSSLSVADKRNQLEIKNYSPKAQAIQNVCICWKPLTTVPLNSDHFIGSDHLRREDALPRRTAQIRVGANTAVG